MNIKESMKYTELYQKLKRTRNNIKGLLNSDRTDKFTIERHVYKVDLFKHNILRNIVEMELGCEIFRLEQEMKNIELLFGDSND